MVKSISLLVIVLLLGTASAVPYVKLAVRIRNGVSAKPGQFPFIVAIQNGTEQYCAGSIINKNWVITAAHCIDKPESYLPLRILAGTNLLHSGGIIYNAIKLIPHPVFKRTNSKDDIGLIKIDGEFDFNNTFVQPIDFGYAESNDTVTAAGWGSDENGNYPEDLRYVDLRALSLEECQEIANNNGDYNNLAPELVCAISDDGNAWASDGDSGGPLISNGKLAGITSYVLLPCARGAPDVYTRPSAYIDWINKNIQE